MRQDEAEKKWAEKEISRISQQTIIQSLFLCSYISYPENLTCHKLREILHNLLEAFPQIKDHHSRARNRHPFLIPLFIYSNLRGSFDLAHKIFPTTIDPSNFDEKTCYKQNFTFFHKQIANFNRTKNHSSYPICIPYCIVSSEDFTKAQNKKALPPITDLDQQYSFIPLFVHFNN